MLVATFRRVLAQAELGRADDFVLVHAQRGLLGVLDLERCVERVHVVVPGNGRSPSGAVLDRSLARAAPGGGSVEDLAKEGSEGR